MKAICFEDIERVSVVSIADPEIEKPTDVIVEVQLAGLCGSDLHPFFGRETGIERGTVMGHEFVGHVVEAGDQVRNVTPGQRVASPFTTNCGKCFYCRRGVTARCESGQVFGWRQRTSGHQEPTGLHGGQAERVRVPLADTTLLPIEEDFDAKTALLLGDNLSTAFFGVSMAIDQDTIAEDTYVVVGCGNVGLLAIQAAISLGVQQIFAVDPHPARLAIASALGAEVHDNDHDVIAAVQAGTDGRGADGVMEFVGLPSAQKLAYELVRPAGRLSVIGCHCTPDFTFSPAQAYDKNLTYRTGRCSARSWMEDLKLRLQNQPFDFSWCITHQFGIDDAVEAYDTFAYRKANCVKAVVEMK